MRDLRRTMNRINLRKSYAQFFSEPNRTGQERSLREFTLLLSILESKPFQYRGLGVRYGQLAQMHRELGNLDDAYAFVQEACSYSEKVSDWRSLAKNHLEWARVFISDKDNILSARNQLQISRDILDRIYNQDPELEYEHFFVKSQFFTKIKSYDEAMQSIEDGIRVINDIRERIQNDSGVGKSGAIGLFNEPRAKSVEKRYAISELESLRAAVIDMSNLSFLQERLLGIMAELDNIKSNRHIIDLETTWMEFSTWFSPHHLGNQLNAFKELALREIDVSEDCESFKSYFSIEIDSMMEELKAYSKKDSIPSWKWISMRNSVEAVICDYKNNGNIEVLAPKDDSTDFELLVSEYMLEYAISSLLDNSSNALRGSVIGGRGFIKLHVYTVSVNGGRIWCFRYY